MELNLSTLPRRSHLLCAMLACLGGNFSMHAAESQTAQSFERTVTKTFRYQYLVALPTGYDAAAERRWPLLLFLHGAGERGDDVWLVAKHGPPKLLRAAGTDPATKQLAENFIVVSPQCPTGKIWDPEAVLALLDEIIAKHRVDRARVYLTGLSMGGFGTFSVGLKEPQRFAAIVPICGGGNFIDLVLVAPEKKADLLSLGVSVFHGAKDQTVSVAESERMVATLKKAGVKDVQLTVYPDATHDSWTATYANPELYAWLLRHERASAAATK